MEEKICIFLTLAAIFLLSIPAILSYNLWSDVKVFGKTFFDLYDYLSGNVMLTWAGVVLCGYIVFKWGFDAYMRESNMGAKRLRVQPWWKPVVVIIVPLLVLAVAVGSLLNV